MSTTPHSYACVQHDGECICGVGFNPRYACPCGRKHEAIGPVAQLIEDAGLTVKVVTPQGAWRVPRIYIAIHGLRASDMPMLARVYGWKTEKP